MGTTTLLPYPNPLAKGSIATEQSDAVAPDSNQSQTVRYGSRLTAGIAGIKEVFIVKNSHNNLA